MKIFHWNKILQYKELNIDCTFGRYRNPENSAENQKNLSKKCWRYIDKVLHLKGVKILKLDNYPSYDYNQSIASTTN